MENGDTPINEVSALADASPDVDYSLAEYAGDTRLSVEGLEGYGLRYGKWSGTPAIEIPYFDENGVEVRVRVRIALSGDRFRWRPGDELIPYGLWRLGTAREHDLEGR